jgi:hypothetical protein
MTQEALRMALEALEENHHLIEEHERPEYLVHYDQIISLLAKALAKEQEPVKIIQYNCTCGRTMKFESVHGVVAPQRTWVGLTDDEIAHGWKESWVTEQAFQSAVWWAEEKLKEKNT